MQSKKEMCREQWDVGDENGWRKDEEEVWRRRGESVYEGQHEARIWERPSKCSNIRK